MNLLRIRFKWTSVVRIGVLYCGRIAKVCAGLMAFLELKCLSQAPDNTLRDTQYLLSDHPQLPNPIFLALYYLLNMNVKFELFKFFKRYGTKHGVSAIN